MPSRRSFHGRSGLKTKKPGSYREMRGFMARCQKGYKLKTQDKISDTALIKAILDELPFLRRYFDFVNIRKITITEIDFGITKHRVNRILNTAHGFGFYEEDLDDMIHLFTSDGFHLGQVGVRIADTRIETRRFLWWTWNKGIPKHGEMFSETVGEALDRLNEGGKTTRYIVTYFNDKGEKRLVIGHPPRGLTVKQAFDNELGRAKVQVRTQLFA